MDFKIYKRGQGKYTRLYSALAAAIIVALGCWRLYRVLEATDWGLGNRANLWIATIAPVVLLAALMFFIYWIMNKPSIADFMIAAEGEMKKVSWSSRQEITVSTIVVIIVVIIMAMLLGAADYIFGLFFTWLLG